MVNAEQLKEFFILHLTLERSGRDALEVFEEAINNIMPVLEVKLVVWVVQTTKYQLRSPRTSYYSRITLVS